MMDVYVAQCSRDVELTKGIYFPVTQTDSYLGLPAVAMGILSSDDGLHTCED